MGIYNNDNHMDIFIFHLVPQPNEITSFGHNVVKNQVTISIDSKMYSLLKNLTFT